MNAQVGLAAAVAVVLLTLGLATTSAARGASGGKANASIIGGYGASISELPWLAFIESESAEGFSDCTGTVIAPRLILTAAHCVQDIRTGTVQPAGSFIVVTGVANLNEATQANLSLVSNALVYPGFKPSTMQRDAGLLVLASPVAAPAIPLAGPAHSPSLRAGTGTLIAGWGVTQLGGGQATAQLQVATSAVQGPAYCRQQVRGFYPYFSATVQLCTIEPPNYGTSTCHGDSGGPLIAARPDGSLVQIGITSLGEPACKTTRPSVFTRVDLVSAWAGAWIAAVETGAPPPAIAVPKVRFPTLTLPEAKRLMRIGLAEDFRYRYSSGAGERNRCERIEKTKVKCGISWYQGPNDYWGTATVYLTQERNSLVWSMRYKIHWVNDYCWFYRGHRKTCVIRTRTR